jgi:hypothetical protein
MIIPASSYPISYVRTELKPKANKKDDFSSIQTNQSLPNVNAKSSSYSSVWEELKKKYDVNNASNDEISAISTTLYNSGQISLRDHATLTFDPSKSPQQINGTIYLTQANGNKRNWITEYQARAEQSLKFGDTQSYIQNKHIEEILERLQR